DRPRRAAARAHPGRDQLAAGAAGRVGGLRPGPGGGGRRAPGLRGLPLIEESERIQARSAKEEYERLHADVWPELRLGLLHGQMPSKEKEATMAAFRRRDLDVLVSTTVIEVGVDVPNATVMLVEDAVRFGMAQLHQLRGRVGRGAAKSWCYLLGE